MDELYKRQPPDVTPDIRFAEERYAKELAVAPPTAPSSTATTPAATASGSGARSPSSGFLSSSVSTPLEGLSEDVADPDVEEVLGSDGYLRPGHFINLVESEKAKARRAERDQMLRHMKLKMERRKARREAKRLARYGCKRARVWPSRVWLLSLWSATRIVTDGNLVCCGHLYTRITREWDGMTCHVTMQRKASSSACPAPCQ